MAGDHNGSSIKGSSIVVPRGGGGTNRTETEEDKAIFKNENYDFSSSEARQIIMSTREYGMKPEEDYCQESLTSTADEDLNHDEDDDPKKENTGTAPGKSDDCSRTIALKLRNLVIRSTMDDPQDHDPKNNQRQVDGLRKMSTSVRPCVWQMFKKQFQSMCISSECKRRVVQKQLGMSQRTLLAIVCTYKAPLDVMQLLIDVSSSGPDTGRNQFTFQDAWGRTALLTAIMYGLSTPQIRLLVDADVSCDSLHIVGSHDGRTPLHAAIEFGSDPITIQYLINAENRGTSLSPRTALSTRDRDGLTPLERAITVFAPPTMLDALIDASPEEIIASVMHQILSNNPVGEVESTDNGVYVPAHYYHCFGKACSLSPCLQELMNEKVSRDSKHIALFLLYLFTLILIIVGYVNMVEEALSRGWAIPDNIMGAANIPLSWPITVLVATSMLLLFEILQFLGQGVNWLLNPWNWFDMALIVMTLTVTFLVMFSDGSSSGVQVLVTANGFLLFILLLARLRVTFLPFAIFVEGCIQAFPRLFPFLISTIIIFFGFVFLYRTRKAVHFAKEMMMILTFALKAMHGHRFT